jgi:peroxiredoxin
MVATFWLLGCVLASAQAPARPMAPPSSTAVRGDWVLTPRLARGQELIYRGTFTEQAGTGLGGGSTPAPPTRVQFQRAYRFETRFFVLDNPPRGVRLAAFSTLQDRTARPAKAGVRVEPVSSSVRLERIELDLQGKVQADPAVSLTVPLNGPPTLEIGAFIEVPRSRPALEKGWEKTEADRPNIKWRIAGTEAFNGQPCVKVVGVQQSEDWDRPRADRGSWRRQETVWIAPRSGISVRVERIIEQREPAHRETTQKSILRYELESCMALPAQLAVDYRQEVLHTLSYRETAMPMLRAPANYTRDLERLHRKITSHLEGQPTTPYREAMLLLKRQVEAARRGEVLPIVHAEPTRPVVATVGEPAPDFVASAITSAGSGRLARWKGKPILLVFYHPSSSTAGELLRFAQEVHTNYGKFMSVIGLSVLDDSAPALKQHMALKLGFPLLHGGGMRFSYGVDTTPKMILIDSAGVVRGTYTGWGRETTGEVVSELRRWLPH